ncbi:MAG: ATP-binding protein [Arenimonas sp.]
MPETVPPVHESAPRLTRKQLLIVFCLALGLLFAVAVLVCQESRREALARNMVTNTLLVLKQAIELENSALGMEASQRGFLISGHSTQLVSRDAGYADAARLINILTQLVSDNPEQVRRMKQCAEDLDKRYAIMRANSTFASDENLTEARTRFRASGEGSIEPVRKILASVRLEENRLLTKRLQAYEQRRAKFQWLLIGGTGLALLLLGACAFALHRQLVYGEQVAAELAQSNEQLKFAYEVSKIGSWELNLVTGKTKRSLLHDQIFGNEKALAEWGYDSFTRYVHPEDAEQVDQVFQNATRGENLDFECRIIWQDKSQHWISVHGRIYESPDGDRSRMLGTIADITARKEAEQAISQLNRELLARTVELQAANLELESFSYSVSHDLRAPLRHIDGYARMLVEDAADQLQPESQRYLQTIIGSARRMGMLIDDLLTFSRLGRKPLAKQEVNMQDLVASVLNDLSSAKGEDVAEIKVSSLPLIYGDPALLRQVWTNLISNAIKYSAPRGEQAHIEIAGEAEGGHIHYWVKDNGVGFDMRYADKLFGVFQRMHPQDQFEGTGVGLAIVQRIISRHAGRVFATAEKDKGACFSFELPIGDLANE